MKPHEIVGQVHEAFPKIVRRLSSMTGKSDEWFHSHHREPKSDNPMQTGNKSATTHFHEECALYEGAAPGAGVMLAHRVAASIAAEFADEEILNFSPADVLRETCDVHQWLAKFRINDASAHELVAFERECDEAIEALTMAKASARGALRELELRERRIRRVA